MVVNQARQARQVNQVLDLPNLLALPDLLDYLCKLSQTEKFGLFYPERW